MASRSGLLLSLFWLSCFGCRRTPVDARVESDGSAQAASASRRQEHVATDACAEYLRNRGVTRASKPTGEVKLSDPEASSWRRPATIRCELCGAPSRDGDRIVGRLVVVNTAREPAKVYLQSASHGPFWFDTVPPAPPPPPPPTPMPEVYPAPLLWTIQAGEGFDVPIEATVAPDVLAKGGSVRVRASAVFWNGGGLELCGEATVQL